MRRRWGCSGLTVSVTPIPNTYKQGLNSPTYSPRLPFRHRTALRQSSWDWAWPPRAPISRVGSSFARAIRAARSRTPSARRRGSPRAASMRCRSVTVFTIPLAQTPPDGSKPLTSVTGVTIPGPDAATSEAYSRSNGHHAAPPCVHSHAHASPSFTARRPTKRHVTCFFFCTAQRAIQPARFHCYGGAQLPTKIQVCFGSLLACHCQGER